ncbi:MAG TPA: hypothetical protein PLH19_04420 [Anaerolineae bacterium]|nr:hypothetical protein [Anaerolineae bacterium]HQH37766.1 hypothetical protein [Anaerolineae bacterium]
MLKQLVALIGEGNLSTPQDLAEALSVPAPLVAQMIEQLTQAGYLVESQPWADSCRGCGLENTCRAQPAGRVWTLTAKGRAAAAGL